MQIMEITHAIKRIFHAYLLRMEDLILCFSKVSSLTYATLLCCSLHVLGLETIVFGVKELCYGLQCFSEGSFWKP